MTLPTTTDHEMVKPIASETIVKSVCFPVLVLGLFILGVSIPGLYDWSGADQSRSSPQMECAFWVLIGAAILAWLTLPWLPMRRDDVGERPRGFQFGVRGLFLVTSFVAVVIAGLVNMALLTCVCSSFLAFFVASRAVAIHLSWRWQLPMLLASMYLPYMWVLTSGEFDELEWHLLAGLFGLPAFFPSIVIGSMLGMHLEKGIWLLLLITAIEIAFGTWMVRLGPRRTIAWSIFVVLVSLVGSMGLHALMRM